MSDAIRNSIAATRPVESETNRPRQNHSQQSEQDAAEWRATVERIYRENRGELWAVFYSRCTDRELASDALHEAFHRILRQSAETVHKPLSWLRAAGCNWLMDRHRRVAAERRAKSARQPTSRPGNPVDNLLNEESRQSVREALKELSEPDRLVLVLRYGLKWSTRQIAAHLNASIAAIDMRMSRARRSFAANMQSRS